MFPMEGCLLCLKLKPALTDMIFANSNQWHELNIQNIVDKYLWPMSHIGTSSWICAPCWTELHEFDQFYTRTEEAHKNFGLLKKNVREITPNKEKSVVSEIKEIDINELNKTGIDIGINSPVHEVKNFFNKRNTNNKQLRSYLKSTEQKTLIKIELREEPSNDFLVKSRKRGRPRKNSYYETDKSKAVLNKMKKRNKSKVKDIYHDIDNTKEVTNKAKEDTQAIESIPESITNQVDNLEMCKDAKIVPQSIETKYGKDQASLNYQAKTIRNAKDKFLAENFQITCFLCDIPLETFCNMRKHFEEHHTELGHVRCCNKKFYRRSILIDHVHYHLDPEYFKCIQCGKVMEDRRRLDLHIKTHEINNGKNHCCEICGKGFIILGLLNKHRMIHLSEQEKRFPCLECGKNFAKNYLLNTHYRTTHLKTYVKICDICGKSIRDKSVFERHMLQHEGKTTSVSCDICGLLLTDNKALKRHKEIIHPVGGQKEYTCSICSKTSPNFRAHKLHVQYKHVMGYTHKCTICDKAFKRAPTLKEHMASHTGTILYTCPWCPKTFNSNANMHNHRKKVHPKEWEEASRKRYSGKLPPHFKPPTKIEPADLTELLDA